MNLSAWGQCLQVEGSRGNHTEAQAVLYLATLSPSTSQFPRLHLLM